MAAIKAAGSDAFAIQGDLTKVSEIESLFDQVVKRFGGLDIAVNTVGKVLKKPIVEVTEEEYDSLFAINSKSAFFFIRKAGRRMNENGKIVTVLTSLLAAFTASMLFMLAARRRWRTLRARRQRSSDCAESQSTVSRRARWTHVLLSRGVSGIDRLSQVSEHERKTHRDPGYRSHCKISRHRRLWITGQTLFANGGYTTR